LAGDGHAVLEAMKVGTEVVAPLDGRVRQGMAMLQRASGPESLDLDAGLVGAPLDNFVLMQSRKHLEPTQPQFYYWRTVSGRGGSRSGRLGGTHSCIEAKTSRTLHMGELCGLQVLSDALRKAGFEVSCCTASRKSSLPLVIYVANQSSTFGQSVNTAQL